jgi:gas vesicle protein
MNIEELLESLPSREDIASAVGFQRRGLIGGNTDILPMLGVFGTGMLFGAGLALLFSPKTGSELRRNLSEKAHEWGEQARDMAEEYSSSGQQGQTHHGTQQTHGQTSQGGQGSEHRTSYSGTTGGRNI